MAEMLLISHDSLSRYRALSDLGESVGLRGAAAASSCTLGSGGGGGEPTGPASTTTSPSSIPCVVWEWEREEFVVGQRPKRAVKILSGGVCQSARDGRSWGQWGQKGQHVIKYNCIRSAAELCSALLCSGGIACFRPSAKTRNHGVGGGVDERSRSVPCIPGTFMFP